MRYAFKVWLFFHILSLVFGFGLIGILPPYVPNIIQIYIMAIGFYYLFTLDERKKEVPEIKK